MNEGLIPGRYAKALLEFASESKQDTHVYDLMHNLDNSFTAEPSMSKVLANPFVDAKDKVKLLMTAAGATGDDEVYSRFLSLLVENNRIDMARAIALAYMNLYRKVNNIYLVTVTSASPLTAAEEKRLKSLIERHLNGGRMEYQSATDADLIGGFVVTVNNEKLDASVANELKQMRLKLLSN